MDLLEKIREELVGGTSIVFTRRGIADKTFIRISTYWCIIEIDTRQLYPFTMCQAMPTGLYLIRELVSGSCNLKPRQNHDEVF